MFNRLFKKICVVATSVALAVTSVVSGQFGTMTVNAASDVNVNLASEKQTMQGIGGMNHPVWISDLTTAQRQKVFGNGENQLGFTILRIHVDENRNNWSKELATAKAAQEAGALIFASPWNPPAEMCEKTSTGKRLKYSSYGAYAQHLNDFVSYMKQNGVNLYAISIQNEPDYAHEWTAWTPTEIVNFMKNYAGKINCKVMAPESFQYLKNMSDPILNDPAALANMDILGTHFYGTQTKNMAYPLFKQKGTGKELWMTEVYVPDSTSSADAWPNALQVAVNMNDAFTVGDMQAYVWWYIRRSYGPLKENGEISKRGYCMAQYSKFVRRGYKRVDATANPNTKVYVSAFKGDGKAVIVAVNDSDTTYTQFFNVQNGNIKSVDRYRTSANENLAKTSNLSLTGNGFYAQLPARSVSTFVCDLGTGSNTGTTQPSEPSQPTQPTESAVPGNTVRLEDGWYYIKNVNAQKYVQVEGNTGKAGQNVELRTGTGVDGQKWYLTNAANGYVTLKSALGNFMLDIANGSAQDGANLIIYNAYSGDAQQFMLKSTSTSGVYVIATKASNGVKVLDDYEHSKADGANVCQWKYYGNANQQFVFEKVNSQTSGSTTQPSQPTQPETPSQGTGLPSGVTCEYTVVSDWGGSYQAQVVLKNGSKNTLSNWALTFEYANKISNLWGADFVGQSGNTVSVKAPSWDANLAPGKSVTIQFIASGNSNVKPGNYSVK